MATARVEFGFAPVFTRYEDSLRQVTSRLREASLQGLVYTAVEVVNTTRTLTYVYYQRHTGRAGQAWQVIGGSQGVGRAGPQRAGQEQAWTVQVGSEAEVDEGGYNRFLNQGWTDRGGNARAGKLMLQEALKIHSQERTLPRSIARHWGSGIGRV